MRITDIIGKGSNLDSNLHPIYDPYPGDNGFNVDAIGVISAALNRVDRAGRHWTCDAGDLPRPTRWQIWPG